MYDLACSTPLPRSTESIHFNPQCPITRTSPSPGSRATSGLLQRRIMSSSSSDGASLAFALLNGAASANPDVVASFRVGDNSISPDGLPEFALSDGAENGHGDAAPV